MNRIPYSFSVLRHVHDSVTQEFVNIGVAVYSRDAGYFQARCATNYSRITKMFATIDGSNFRNLTEYIQGEIERAASALRSELPFEPARAIEHLLARILPPDESSVQFAPAGVGLSHNLDTTLRELFDRYVERYTGASDQARRNDEEVWRTVFKEPLERRHVTSHLAPKRIVAPNYDYEFQHAWKNSVWHVYEPVSFDLLETASILDKANRWLGRATSLKESSENFKIHLLLGEPDDSRLRPAFTKAENILNKIPGNKEFIRESQAEQFAEEFASEVLLHEKPE